MIHHNKISLLVTAICLLMLVCHLTEVGADPTNFQTTEPTEHTRLTITWHYYLIKSTQPTASTQSFQQTLSDESTHPNQSAQPITTELMQETTLPNRVTNPCTDMKNLEIPPGRRDIFKNNVKDSMNAKDDYCANTSNYEAEFFCFICIRHPYEGFLNCYKMCSREDGDECSWRCIVKPQGYNESFLSLFTEIREENANRSAEKPTPTPESETALKTLTAAATSPYITSISTNVATISTDVTTSFTLSNREATDTVWILVVILLTAGLVSATVVAIYFGVKYRKILKSLKPADADEEAAVQFIKSSESMDTSARAEVNLASSTRTVDSTESALLR